MKLRLLFLSLIATHFLMAHVGGHDHHNANLKTWTFDDGSTIQGNYSLSKNGNVYIETSNHTVIAYPVETLAQKDEQYVQQKMKEVQKINGVSTEVENHKEQPSKNESSNAEIPIYLYFLLGGVLVFQVFIFMRTRGTKSNATSTIIVTLITVSVIIAACNKKGCTDPLAENYSEKAKKDDGSCTYQFSYSESPNANDVNVMSAAFAPYAPHVSTSSNGTTFYVEADAIPNHDMMTGITAWIDQFPVYQKMSGNNSWQIPIAPSYSDAGYNIVDNFRKYAIGLAANGIAIFNPYNATGEISADIGELDEYGGHAGTGDDYHYHLPPTHLDNPNAPTIIAYALDGFPVYGELEPDGTPMQELDPTYHGHEINGSFHYHAATSYPYMINTFRGMVGVDNAQDAPYDQITPQPSTQNFRGNPYPLSGGASSTLIDSCVANGTENGYTLYYTINGNEHKKVEYHWVAGATDTITFNFYNDTGSNLDITQVWTR